MEEGEVILYEEELNKLCGDIVDLKGNGITIINIHGPEGSGKSHFAFSLVSRCKGTYPDAAMHLSFTGDQSTDKVCNASHFVDVLTRYRLPQHWQKRLTDATVLFLLL